MIVLPQTSTGHQYNALNESRYAQFDVLQRNTVIKMSGEIISVHDVYQLLTSSIRYMFLPMQILSIWIHSINYKDTQVYSL